MRPPIGPLTSHSAHISSKITCATCHRSLLIVPKRARNACTCALTALRGRAPLLFAITGH
jgi:hypothetical protein